MFIVVQFPITDLRSFSSGEPKRIKTPSWPCPSDSQYVRNLGSINPRKLGGIDNWIGESRLCKANRACRFQDIFPNISSDKLWKVTPKFRRFFFDGHITGKFEFGFKVDIESEGKRLDSNSLKNLIKFIFKVNVRVPKDSKCFSSSDLISCGDLLAKLYSRSSAQNLNGTNKDNVSSLVKAGSPLLFLETLDDEKINIPFYSTKENFYDLYGFKIEHFWFKEKNKNIRCWWLAKNKHQNISAREIRVSLLRLNAMRESLEFFLGELSGDNLKLKPRSVESEKVQLYFNNVVEQCFKLPASVEGTDILALAHQTDSGSLPGNRVALLNKLKYELDIRRQILEKAASALDMRDALRGADINIGDTIMGDKYHNNQGGIIGPNGTVSNSTFNQISNNNETKVDFVKLAEELSLLRKEMQENVSTAEEFVEVGAIAEAELEANKGNYEKVLKALSKTGEWSLSVGEKIGVGVAILAIKSACGL
ncbi:hypothetical protein [Vreelandella titanicae]|uniref:hypothetical protein n=1 Tax=Vreelandella titanicae TaxID=664683 RepID=UPI001680433A|nr:hypothetical protein [Halomonas titanicae]QNU63658.1 hypothetical protein HZS52_04690 [Halomonas titanicae]